ncbi:hypothetical protein GCM10009682_21720 [Luedemannella flava]|uniref:Uncharacterized protein n=1 Tax=Luedemannella flava TaxID=349316 RepID=A0ABN2LUN1_9ACTN
MKLLARIGSTVKLQLDWIITVALAVGVSILGLVDGVSTKTVLTTTLLVLGVFAVGWMRDRVAADQLRKDLKNLPQAVHNALTGNQLLNQARVIGLSAVYPNAIDKNWLPEIEAAREVRIVKLKLNLTENPDYLQALCAVLRRGGKVTVVMGDPRAPAIWLRYKEEPHGLPGERNTETAWINGLAELAVEVARLESWRQKLLLVAAHPNQVYIGLSTAYPTHAYYCFDSTTYVYHYAYMARGYYSPMFVFDEHTAQHSLVAQGCAALIGDSITLSSKVAADIARKLAAGAFADARVNSSTITVTHKSSGAKGI